MHTDICFRVLLNYFICCFSFTDKGQISIIYTLPLLQVKVCIHLVFCVAKNTRWSQWVTMKYHQLKIQRKRKIQNVKNILPPSPTPQTLHEQQQQNSKHQHQQKRNKIEHIVPYDYLKRQCDLRCQYKTGW